MKPSRDFLHLSEPPVSATSLYGHLTPGGALAASMEVGEVISPMRIRLLILVSVYPGMTSRDACRMTRRIIGSVQRDLDTLRRHGLVRAVTANNGRYQRLLWSVSSIGGAFLKLLYGSQLEDIQHETAARIDWLVGEAAAETVKPDEEQGLVGAGLPAQA